MATATASRLTFRKPSVIPGFGITFGLTLTWLCLIVLLPLSALFLKTSELSFDRLVTIMSNARTLHALQISFGLSLAAAAINLVFGGLVVWVLVRYDFPFKRVVDAIIDIPFALPTAVAGIALTTLYAENGWIGSLLAPLGIQVSFTPLGILVALVFIGLPFVVRTVQPVLADLDAELEDAAASLGATRSQTIWRVVLPTIWPALLTGFAMAFARAVGEYGSVIFIAGNLPGVSEIAPLLIVIRLEEFRYADATAIASVMLLASFVLLFIINRLQSWAETRGGREH
ncbi:sulfate ABC transporter permease subunit CysT [Xanthobacter sp. VNH20]|uniref:sulfate ABC transporter permease subunit CysT n=1 Tax=Xanthobacter sp. VNH20 TaxID=3156616 RepID=UPI0032B5B449